MVRPKDYFIGGNGMKICKKYELANDEYTCKYLVQVYDNFICVNRFDLGQNGEMKPTESIEFHKDFAYKIAKKIIEEYEEDE